jgi:hypothetical protein
MVNHKNGLRREEKAASPSAPSSVLVVDGGLIGYELVASSSMCIDITVVGIPLFV